jgi:hypothetical protein
MAKRKWMVMKRTKKPITIDTGRGERKTWRDKGGRADFFYVSNEAEAKEIDEVYGMKTGTGDVWVKEHGQAGHDASYHEENGRFTRTHNYFFAGMGADLQDHTNLENDPNWEEYSPGRWRRINKKKGTVNGAVDEGRTKDTGRGAKKGNNNGRKRAVRASTTW